MTADTSGMHASGCCPGIKWDACIFCIDNEAEYKASTALAKKKSEHALAGDDISITFFEHFFSLSQEGSAAQKRVSSGRQSPPGTFYSQSV